MLRGSCEPLLMSTALAARDRAMEGKEKEVLGLSEVEKQEAELAMGYRSAATGGLCLWLQNAIAAKGKPRAGGAEAVKE